MEQSIIVVASNPTVPNPKATTGFVILSGSFAKFFPYVVAVNPNTVKIIIAIFV